MHCGTEINSNFGGRKQGRSDEGGYQYLYTPKKSAQVNFLWGKNDVRMAIQQFYTPPKKQFLAMPLGRR